MGCIRIVLLVMVVAFLSEGCEHSYIVPGDYKIDPSIQNEVDSLTIQEGDGTMGRMFLEATDNDSVVVNLFDHSHKLLGFTGAWCNEDSLRIMSITGLGTSAGFMYTKTGTGTTLKYVMGDDRDGTYRLLPSDTIGHGSLEVPIESSQMVLSGPLEHEAGTMVCGFVDLRTKEFYSVAEDSSLIRHRIHLKAYFKMPMKTGARERF